MQVESLWRQREDYKLGFLTPSPELFPLENCLKIRARRAFPILFFCLYTPIKSERETLFISIPDITGHYSSYRYFKIYRWQAVYCFLQIFLLIYSYFKHWFVKNYILKLIHFRIAYYTLFPSLHLVFFYCLYFLASKFNLYMVKSVHLF